MNTSDTNDAFGIVVATDGSAGTPAIDAARITEPFELPSSVVRGFCTHCGSYPEFGAESAEKLAKIAQVTKTTYLPGEYFQINTCSACSAKTEKDTVELKTLSVPGNT